MDHIGWEHDSLIESNKLKLETEINYIYIYIYINHFQTFLFLWNPSTDWFPGRLL
jgi:hypothetical protein